MISIFARRVLLLLLPVISLAAGNVMSRDYEREFSLQKGGFIEVTNNFGRIDIIAVPSDDGKGSIKAIADTAVSESEIKLNSASGRITITVAPSGQKRIDITITIPERSRSKLKTNEGEIRVEGNHKTVEASTDTGTIAANVPVFDLKYAMQWTASRPRVIADFELAKIRERSAGRFELKGSHSEDDIQTNADTDEKIERDISLDFTTARGIILLNVPPNEVTGDLRERPLTNAAKAIIKSGDSVMMDAIRRAAPKYFSDYERTLPPLKKEPTLTENISKDKLPAAVKRATVHVFDKDNRTITNMTAADFEVSEGNVQREIISVKQVDSTVNLVLLLDVSGSIENYVTFIRKAARSFVNAVDKDDRISIVAFNEDVNVLAGFSTDRKVLSESLDTFDAGGSTAYYDALGFTIAETLRPIRDQRTAVVILSDGDDNRSFLAFESVFGAIQESGAVIYPLYVPSSLIAASAPSGFQDIDPLRNRHLTLTSKADSEGRRLAQETGGLYFPINQLSQINTAYDDIVKQLRTAYEITYRSDPKAPSGGGTVPRARIRTNKPNAFVHLGPVVPVN